MPGGVAGHARGDYRLISAYARTLSCMSSMARPLSAEQRWGGHDKRGPARVVDDVARDTAEDERLDAATARPAS